MKGATTMVTKKDLTAEVAETTDLSKKDTEEVINAFLDSVKNSLKKGEKVSIAGFGNFEIRERSARVGRNPRTGESMNIAASKVPAFKAGKELKELVK